MRSIGSEGREVEEVNEVKEVEDRNLAICVLEECE